MFKYLSQSCTLTYLINLLQSFKFDKNRTKNLNCPKNVMHCGTTYRTSNSICPKTMLYDRKTFRVVVSTIIKN